MTPLYDVLTVQPSLDAGQLQIKDMKLAMRAGKSRHYKVSEIMGRHFLETGLEAGLSRKQVETIFSEIREAGDAAFAKTRALMPKEFPDALFASVKAGFDQRLARMTLT
jgi:serine/threonine-protein kinase HipA